MDQAEHVVLMAIKSPARGKSRLEGHPAGSRQDLARAFAHDTVAVAVAVAGPGRVVVCTDDDDIATLVEDLGALSVKEDRPAGLNAALGLSAAVAADRWPGQAVAALQGDLPCLRPDHLRTVLALCAQRPAPAYVADLDGAGTVLLAHPPGSAFVSAFGEGSAHRHRSLGAADLVTLEPRVARLRGLRRDVDTAADLEQALALGVGPATRAVLARTVMSAP